MVLGIVLIALALFVTGYCVLNWDKIKEFFSRRSVGSVKKDKPAKNEKKSKNLNYDENVYEKMKVDNLNKEIEGEPFVNVTEDELEELEAKPKDLGRKKQEKERPRNIAVEVEDLGDYDVYEPEEVEKVEDVDDSDIDFSAPASAFDFFGPDPSEQDIANKIQNLPADIKALLLSNALGKRDDENK